MKYFLIVLVIFILLTITSCASHSSTTPLKSTSTDKPNSPRSSNLLKKPTIQAVKLRDDCIKLGIISDAATIADSLYTKSKEMQKRKKGKESYYLMCLASAYYTLALSEDESEKKVNALEEQLEKARQDIETYKEALEKVATMKEK